MNKKIVIMAMVAVVLVVGGVIGIFAATKTGVFSTSAKKPNNGDNLKNGNDGETNGSSDDVMPRKCEEAPPSKRMVMYWQSENLGCDDPKNVPDGVTHVVFGFLLAQGNTSSVKQVHQAISDKYFKKCVKSLKSRCIKSLLSIGGWTNREELATIKDYDLFSKNVMSVVEEFDLDGIDIDDENWELFNPTHYTKYMETLGNDLKKKGKLMSMCVFAYDVKADRCVMGNRCYPKELNKVMDWIHVMAYNVQENPEVAFREYKSFEKGLFLTWVKEGFNGNKSMLNIGFNLPRAKAYGPPPPDDVVKSWCKFSTGYGGMMMYSGHVDKQEENDENAAAMKKFLGYMNA